VRNQPGEHLVKFLLTVDTGNQPQLKRRPREEDDDDDDDDDVIITDWRPAKKGSGDSDHQKAKIRAAIEVVPPQPWTINQSRSETYNVVPVGDGRNWNQQNDRTMTRLLAEAAQHSSTRAGRRSDAPTLESRTTPDWPDTWTDTGRGLADNDGTDATESLPDTNKRKAGGLAADEHEFAEPPAKRPRCGERGTEFIEWSGSRYGPQGTLLCYPCSDQPLILQAGKARESPSKSLPSIVTSQPIQQTRSGSRRPGERKGPSAFENKPGSATQTGTMTRPGRTARPPSVEDNTNPAVRALLEENARLRAELPEVREQLAYTLELHAAAAGREAGLLVLNQAYATEKAELLRKLSMFEAHGSEQNHGDDASGSDAARDDEDEDETNLSDHNSGEDEVHDAGLGKQEETGDGGEESAKLEDDGS
jgi:hypothetical protein